MMRGETIAAVATPPGRGAIAILRVSGAGTRSIARRLVRASLKSHRATVTEIVDTEGALLDRGVALLWASPRSYTGEDVLELHVHGSPVIVRQTLEAVLASGARLAEPGEFTRRAFMNGKLDLSEASAVADLIASETRAAARAALANAEGALSRDVRALRETLLVELETLAGAIDFPDEVPDPHPAALDDTLARVETALQRLRESGELGRIVREGVTAAIVGPPNAGKSSLLNALLGEERALVSELPGTTRDTIEESIVIDGVAVRLVDTAGIRTHADRLEAAGIERAMRALEDAQMLVVTLDGSRPLGAVERDVLRATEHRDRVVFCNKADLGDVASAEIAALAPIVGSVYEARTLHALRAAIARVGWNGDARDLTQAHCASAFEIDAVGEALYALAHARATLRKREPVDLCAGELQRAVAALGHVRGEAAADEVIDRVFARFCIGK